MYASRLIILAFGTIISLNQVSGLSCERGKIPCPNRHKCIPPRYICDNGNDCGDRSDEAYCRSTPNNCPSEQFRCSNGSCMNRNVFCNGRNDCGDNSDEFYCDFPVDRDVSITCRTTWMKCNDQRRCIQENWKCNGIVDCFDGSDEMGCTYASQFEKHPKVIAAKNLLIEWFLQRRKNDSSTEKWGPHKHRIATALYLANESFFAPGSRIGEELGYEVTFQLICKLSGNNTIRTEEMSLYIHALLVTCSDPRNFFGHDLVSELRGRVERTNYTNPFAILALCNAGDSMTEKDVERVTMAFDLHHRPFWTDTQAIAFMALQCISLRSNVRVDERTLREMERELKKRQFRNGTVDNTITTSLVVQALFYNKTYKEHFDLDAAIAVLLENQKEDGSWDSVQNSYYVLPILSHKSLVNISTGHCRKSPESEEEALTKLQEAKGEKFVVQYSVWIGNDIDLGRTWRLKMTINNTFYDVIETIRRIDSRHNVMYNVIDDKPYVSALYGKQDDSELGMYWFTYVRPLLKQEEYRFVEASPVDVKIQPNQEIILWYKYEAWVDKA